MNQENVAAFAQLWCRLLFEDYYTPGCVDAVYLHGLSEGMVASCDLFDLVAHITASGRARFLAFNGSDGRGMPPQDRPGAAWPGVDWYRQEFCKRNIEPMRLLPTRDGLHTRDECDALIELTKEHQWRSVGIVTVPYHWPRVLSCLVGAIAGADYNISIHFVRPKAIRWHYSMIGSQGVEHDSTFLGEAATDVLRLFKYWDKGRESDSWRNAWGAPPEEIFRYLDWRDAAHFSG